MRILFLFSILFYYFVLSNFRIFFYKNVRFFPLIPFACVQSVGVRWKKGARVFNVSHLIMGPPLT